MSSYPIPSSYRDPSGFIFEQDGIFYRQVNKVFQEDFDRFINSGLYQHLIDKKLLVPHKTLSRNLTGTDNWYQTLQPEQLSFVSYPYEWCFDMWKEAALTTIQIAK